MVRKPAKRRSSNLRDCGFNSRLRHLRTCVGWASASPTACKAAAKGCAGSTPARRTDNMARSSIGTGHRSLKPERPGSIPARATAYDRVAQLVDARRSERRAARHGSSSLPLVTDDCRRGRCPTGSHKAGAPGSIPGPATATCCGWASAQPGLISLDGRVRPPDPPLTTGYANWQSDEVESLVILWVRRPPRSHEIPWSNSNDAWVTTRKVIGRLDPG